MMPAARSLRRSTAEPRRDGLSDAALAAAFERREFVLLYQPQLTEAPGGALRLSGVEALLRWNHPRRGRLLPRHFLAGVAAAGLDAELGTYVLREAAAQVRKWLAMTGWAPRVAINLAEAHLNAPRLCSLVLEALGDAGVDAARFAVEVTETSHIHDMASTARELQALREAGVDVAIDDFGCGSSNFQALLQLPFDAIKICPEFVQGIGNRREADEICTAIIQLGHAMGKRVVAEGIEDRRQMEFLRQRRCHALQGFLLAPPMEADMVAQRYAVRIPPPIH